MLAYCTVLGLRSGHLIYANGNEEPAHHFVRKSGVEIICHAIDLDTEPEALLAPLTQPVARGSDGREGQRGPNCLALG
jgi:5-methylcytosine-specific restriction enzyme subunit McrC